MNLPESYGCQQFREIAIRSLCITLAIVLLGFLVGAVIDVFQWLSAVEFFEGSSLLDFGREHQTAHSWIRLCAYSGMLAGMAFGFTKWLQHKVNPHRDNAN